MFKRLFFALLGLGAGLLLGVWAIRKLEDAQRKLNPEYMAGATMARAESLQERIADALQAGRRAAAEKEAQLRAVYRGGTEPS